MLVIGLGHKARHGKNWTAKTMIQHAAMKGLYAREYGFADALRAVCRVQFGMKDKDPQLLQMVGTDLYRRQNEDVWVEALYYRLHEEKPEIAIITDMRFPNEVGMVKNRNFTGFSGYAVKVARTARDGSAWVSTDRDPNHPSETALDTYPHWDSTIVARDGDLSSLEEQARFVFDALYEEYKRKVVL